MNLTCRRNPWKLASLEDASYRAFAYNPDFLKTILPISDELNQILGRIFTHNPAERITLPQLRHAIMACQNFMNTPSHPAQEVNRVNEATATVYEQPAIQTVNDAATFDSPTHLELEDVVMAEICKPSGYGSECHGIAKVDPISAGPASSLPSLDDDSDDSDDSDISDTFSECSDNSNTSMDGIESEGRCQMAPDSLCQDCPVPPFCPYEEAVVPDLSPSPQRFLAQPHVPSLRNHATSSPSSPPAAGTVLPGQNFKARGPRHQTFGLKTTIQQAQGSSRRVPYVSPTPPACNTTPCQGFYEQVWNSVPHFWKFLGPPAPTFYHYPQFHPQTQNHLLVRSCLS